MAKSRAVYLIPNGVTTANIVCGFASILASIDGNYVAAAWAIIAAGIFDLFDGRIARICNAQSRFGEQYDTLSDLLSFGVAPSILFYQEGLRSMGSAGAAIALFYLLSVTFRLARFSVSIGQPSTGYFQGLSSPVSAAIAATGVLFASVRPLEASSANAASAALLAVLAFLMVSSLRFPSFKKVDWKSASGYALLGTLVALLIVAAVDPRLFLFPILCVLLLVVVALDLTSRVRVSGTRGSTPRGQSSAFPS